MAGKCHVGCWVEPYDRGAVTEKLGYLTKSGGRCHIPQPGLVVNNAPWWCEM